MNWDQVEGNWKQLKGMLAQRWGKLTDDDLTIAKANRQNLEGRIQERYGIDKEVAEKQLDDFLREYENPSTAEVAREGGPITTETLKIGM